MKDLGLSLSTGINSFAKGMELGERWKSRMDDDAWNAEVKNRQRAEWKATDDLRAKQNLVNTLQAAREASAAGIDFDPAPVLDAMKQAGQFGASIAQHFAEPEKVQNWVEMADRTIESGQGSPEALEALNWRFADQVNKGVGTTIEQAMQTEAGEIPAGSKIVGKRISTAVPSKSRNGLYFGLDVEVETPDGKRITYPAPMTVGRDTSPNAQVLEVPLDSIFDTIEADKLILSDIQRDPKFAGAIRAALASLGSPVPADKFETVSVEEGDQKVTYQVDARGNRKEIARAPRWQPEAPDKPTTGMREYELAKSQGFPGSYIDFLQAKKGQGFSVTTPDGTVVQMGGPSGGGGLAKPTVNNLEETIVNAQAGLDRLRQVGQSFDPKFLKLQNQAGVKWSEAKDKIGASNENDRQKIAEYETFKSGVLNNLNLYIKEITGAAMSQAEAQRITAAMPNMDDGPSAFKAKYDRVTESLSRALARAYYTRNNGLTTDSVPLEQMDKIIDEYGAKIEKQIKAQNPDMDQAEIERLAMDQVRRAFGM